jgi:phage terminase large subunit-like protein
VGSPPYVDEDGKTDAEKYLEGCLDGSIVAGKKIKKLAEMMLPRFHESHHGFVYSPERATRVVEFIERFCRIPSAENMGMPFILEPYERMIVELAFGFVDDEGYRQFREVLVEIARKNGKSISTLTIIPTPSGWRKMGDIHVGDKVFGQDGRPSTVIAESEIFDKPMYLVTFQDGAEVRASEDHVWTVRRPGGEWHDVTTADIADEVEGGVEYEVPLCGPVEYPEAELEVDPYEMGVLCAESGAEIPEEYMTASVEQRERLFIGIVGRCGHRVYPDIAAYLSVCTGKGNDALMAQVQELASSLGISWTLADGCPGTMVVYTHGDDGKSIVSIERIPNEPSKCIAIDNPSHLYLVGRNYTATHNTSLLAAINNYMLIADGEPAAECYNGATTVQQAKLCYGSTWEMVRMSPHLKKYIRKGIVQKRGITGLNYDANGSYLCTISSRSDSLDGLNMHLGVLDELAASKTPDTYRLLTGAMSARRQPLLVSISTNGKIRNGIWDDRLDYANRVLNGDVADDRFLPILFEQDSKDEVFAGLDEEYRYLWEKSNPGLGTVKKVDSMYDLVKRAFDNRADLPEVLMKQFNIPALEYEAFLEYEDCVNPETFELDPEVDRYCVVGFDLSMSGDISSACAMFRRAGDDRVYELTANWITERKMEVNLKGMKGKDGVPYHVWAQEGWLTVVEGDKIDQVVVVDWINSLVDMGLYPIAIGYDKWHVDDWTKRTLSQVAGDKRVHEVPPGAQTMSPLMQEHKIDLRAKRVINPSPVTAWARMNVQASTTNTGDYSPKKKDLDVTKKIDPYMAELYALKAYKLHEEEYLALIGDPKVVTV